MRSTALGFYYLPAKAENPHGADNQSTMRQSNRSFTLLQAAADSPTLARLSALAQDSNDRLKAIKYLLPEALWVAIQPGPIDGANWCLLVNSNAASAKLRQLAPALLAHLRTKGWDVTSLRVKVQMRRSG